MDRFWSQANKGSYDVCWEWSGVVRKNGYGQFRVGSTKDGSRRIALAHRMSYELYYGIAPGKLCVLHKCDNRRCVNPLHLFLGTKKDNRLDCISKGRDVRGEDHPSSKLADDIVSLIRDDSSPQREIAKHYGVSQSTIWKVKHRRSWSHVE